ncbi:hypothetical protein ACVWW5_005713 [Bradyrhizobium sp. LM3.4]
MTTSSAPARLPRTTRRRPDVRRSMRSSPSDSPAAQRVSPASTSVASTTSPERSVGSRPPATPKEITPRIVSGSSTVSSARNWVGLLDEQMTAIPGPAAMRAS